MYLCSKDRKEKDDVIYYNFIVFLQPVFVSSFSSDLTQLPVPIAPHVLLHISVPFSTPKDVVIL